MKGSGEVCEKMTTKKTSLLSHKSFLALKKLESHPLFPYLGGGGGGGLCLAHCI